MYGVIIFSNFQMIDLQDDRNSSIYTIILMKSYVC